MNDLARGLADRLRIEWLRPVVVARLSATTAGARRHNIVFEADDGRLPRRLVATILPAGETELNPIEAEAALRSLAARAGVPVPRVLAVEEDPGFIGAPFMVSDFVIGETVPRRVLRLVAERGLGATLARQLGDALARLHGIDVTDAPPGLRRLPSGPPAEVAVGALADGIVELTQPRPALVYGLRWLERHVPPPPPRPSILHGDARNGNLIVGPDGLRALLDWEVAVAGADPMQDLAWSALRTWRFRADELEIGGFGRREDLVAGYEAAGGEFDLERFRWWKVAETLRWALGLAAQTAAYLDGRVPSIVMAASGRRVPEMEWDLLMLTRDPE